MKHKSLYIALAVVAVAGVSYYLYRRAKSSGVGKAATTGGKAATTGAGAGAPTGTSTVKTAPAMSARRAAAAASAAKMGHVVQLSPPVGATLQPEPTGPTGLAK